MFKKENKKCVRYLKLLYYLLARQRLFHLFRKLSLFKIQALSAIIKTL